MASDPSDHASELENFFLGVALSQRKAEGPSSTGRCLFCEEPLSDSRRWCDADCRDDWEADQKKPKALRLNQE